MRLSAAPVVTTAAVAAALLLAPSAQAHTGPGDNGTVKIHDAATGEELRKNEPHVCTFYLDAFGFDSAQQVDWHIEAWAPTAGTKGETVKSGTVVLDGEGHGRTEDLGLPDGHYKLFWNFDGEHGSAKHKVFWTECASEGGAEPGGATPTPPADEEPAGQDAPPAEEPSSSPAPSAQGADGDLAETGSGTPVAAVSGIAAVLLAGGGFLVLRRRRARQH